jgi:hypothetical protein
VLGEDPEDAEAKVSACHRAHGRSPAPADARGAAEPSAGLSPERWTGSEG